MRIYFTLSQEEFFAQRIFYPKENTLYPKENTLYPKEKRN